MKERLLRSLTLLLLLCYACNDEADDGLDTVEAAAGNAVVSTARLDTLREDPRDVDALISVTQIYGQLVTVATDGGQIGVVTAAVTKGAVEPDPLADCVTRTENVIRYASCPVSNGIFDGTITLGVDTLTFDLTVSVRSAGAEGSLVVLMQGPIERTAERLEGTVTYTTTIDGLPEFPAGLQLRLDAAYVDIAIDELDCPVSGTLRVEQFGPSADTGLREGFFGPVCGDVRLDE